MHAHTGEHIDAVNGESNAAWRQAAITNDNISPAATVKEADNV